MNPTLQNGSQTGVVTVTHAGPETVPTTGAIVEVMRAASFRDWVLRPTVWLSTASMMMTILHEGAHASTSFMLGVPSTLFNYSVDHHFTQAQLATWRPAIIAVAGPTFCLVLGVLAWWAYKRARGSRAELTLLYFAALGVGTFFGNLVSISFVGDFSQTAARLGLPVTLRYVGSALGALGMIGVQLWLGRELVGFVPENVSRVGRALGVIGVPVVVATFVVIFINQPMREGFVSARLGEAAFSVFAVVAAWVAGKQSDRPGPHKVSWVDVVAMIVAVTIVRVARRGIDFIP
jgi:hypothetical protein